MSVPEEEQFGASSRRPWRLHDDEEVVILWEAILCLVELDETGCLTNDSLERMRRLGIEVTGAELTN